MPHDRILVTGGSGFVGRHVVAALRRTFGTQSRLVCASHTAAPPVEGAEMRTFDLADRAAVQAQIRSLRPTTCVHLAALSQVGASALNPEAAWRVNLHGTLHLAEALLGDAPECRLVHVSSGDIYGLSASAIASIDEDVPPAPANVYAVTKAAADLAVGEFALRGLRVVRLRPFNHTGPGQSADFVVPAIAAQVARAEARQESAAIRVGALDRARDFLDVRDVAEAYVRAVIRFDSLPPGIIINIASGEARSIEAILADFLALARTSITVEQDQCRYRPNDVERVCGSAARAERLLGWRPRIPWRQTLADTLDYWRSTTAAAERSAAP